MVLKYLRSLDDLARAQGGVNLDQWPLSRLFHLNSALGSHTKRSFARQIERFAAEEEALPELPPSIKEYANRPTVELPPVPHRGGRSLRKLLRSRRTRRRFDGSGLRAKELSALLGLSSGVTERIQDQTHPGSQLFLRSWPSGGALYPLELYWCDLGHGRDLSRGVYHYRPDAHCLEVVGDLDPARLWSLLYADNLPRDEAAGALLITAIWSRTQMKYGERGYRIVLLDAGHLGQNVLLVAEDLSLNAVALGGFDDLGLCPLLDIENWEQECTVHAILIGRKPR